MFDIYKAIGRIRYFCKGRMCHECPFYYNRAECNIQSLTELLNDDPCMWDMETIEKVLNREINTNH